MNYKYFLSIFVYEWQIYVSYFFIINIIFIVYKI